MSSGSAQAAAAMNAVAERYAHLVLALGQQVGEMGSELPIDSLSDWITGTWKSN